MDPRSQLDQVIPLLNKVVAQLDRSHLQLATPCANFTVANILEHMIGGATMFSSAFRGETAPSLEMPHDLIAAFPVVMSNLRDAVDSVGALDREIDAPFGRVSGDTFARFVALDGLVHGWDIATATDQPYDPPAEVVAAADQFAHTALTDSLRDGDTFAAAVEAPAGAPDLLRLIAFTGRPV
jgi:uncharacterized protein (TIGR03086 family)